MARVIVAGGGVGGLSVAHELAKAGGFEIHVYEKESVLGGKAASQDAQLGGKTARHLGEHGFRFFPWFYRHLAETLAEIPLAKGPRTFNALEESTHAAMAKGGVLHPIKRGDLGPLDFLQIIQTFMSGLGASAPDMARFSGYLLKFHASCHRRRAAEYEFMSWSRFAGIDDGEYDPDFAKLVDAIPMMLVAMRSSEGSARTLGNVGQQMIYDFDTVSYDKVDAVLEGPSSKVWLEPWVEHLKSLGVVFHLGHELLRIELAPAGGVPRRVQQLVFRHDGAETAIDVSSGYCVCSLPIEAMKPILTPELTAAEPALDRLLKLIDDANGPPWGHMVGAQFFLKQDVPMLKGHAAYPETDWALTSVSQAQFWKAGGHVDPDLAVEFGIPGLAGVISVIASDWKTPVHDEASPVNGKGAQQCTRDEILAEIWRQLAKEAFPAGQAPLPFGAHLDENVQGTDAPTGWGNGTPLLVHPPGSYPRRPPARLPGIGNLVLAADYVQTQTELATMEGANEAGRLAASAILDYAKSPKPWPQTYGLEEGPFFALARALDCVLFDMNVGNPLDLALGTLFMDVPPEGFETFDVPAFRLLAADDLAAWSAAPRVDARRRLAGFREDRVVVVPRARIAYRPFPPPEELPEHLDDRIRGLYRSFWVRREELARFRERPTEESYRLWHDVLSGKMLER